MQQQESGQIINTYRNFLSLFNICNRANHDAVTIEYKRAVWLTAVVHQIGQGVHANGDVRILIGRDGETIVVETADAGDDLTSRAFLLGIPGFFTNNVDNHISNFLVLGQGFLIRHIYFVRSLFI